MDNAVASGKVRWLTGAGCVLLVAGAFAIRSFRLNADPPHGLSYSRGIYTDEGLKYYSARNKALFASWSVKTPKALQGPYRTNPVPTAIGALVFKCFGAGRAQARMISVVSGALSCMLLVLIGLKAGKKAVGLLAGLFAVVNFVWLSYDRLALFESPMVFLCLGALYFYLCGGKRRLVGTPVFLILAFFTRPTALALWAALTADFLLERIRAAAGPRQRKLSAWTAVGLAVVLLASAVVLIIPGNPISRQLNVRDSSMRYGEMPAALVAADFAVRTFSDSVLAEWMPLALVFGLLGAAAAFRAFGEARDRETFVFMLWLAAAFVLVAILDYRPTRYYVMMLPALCYLAADRIVSFVSRGEPRTIEKRWLTVVSHAATGVALALAVTVAVRFVIEHRHELLMFVSLDAPALRRLELFADKWLIGIPPGSIAFDAALRKAAAANMVRHVALFIVIAALLAFLSAFARRLVARIPTGLVTDRLRMIGAALCVMIILIGQGTLAHSHLKRGELRFEIARGQGRIEYLVGPRTDACIGGNWAPTLCMGTPYFTFPLAKGNSNAWDTFKRFPVTHLLLEQGSLTEEIFMRDTYPDEMARCSPLAQIEVDFYTLVLYEYHPPEGRARPPWPMEEPEGK